MRRYEHAHSDYLEELVERGFIGGALLALALGAALVRIAIGLLRRRTRRARALLAGTLIAAVALLVHSVYDFNLQIPANAVYFVVLIALGLKASALPRGV